MAYKAHLLIIDPQNDFCSPPGSKIAPPGSLYVKGADKDMDRVAGMVRRIGKKLEDIHVTEDSHHFIDIAHPVFFRDADGNNPNFFTIITADDVGSRKWTPSIKSLRNWVIYYLGQLEASGRYPLCSWPPHCLISSPGRNTWPPLLEALTEWERDNLAIVDYVTKGSNFLTEHYSAIKAEVPIYGDVNTTIDGKDVTIQLEADISTQVNTPLVQTLMDADIIGICGEAGSHCLANTVRDIATAFGDDSFVKKLWLITDGTSPVDHPDPATAQLFQSWQDDMIKDMTAKGMHLTTTAEFLA